MQLKVQLVICGDDGREEQVQEVAILEKDCQRIEHLGLTLAEAKELLATLQQHLVAQQAATFVAARAQCADCGATLHATTVQHHTLAVAQRCEDELGEEQWAFVEGCPADWATLPIPDGPLTV